MSASYSKNVSISYASISSGGPPDEAERLLARECVESFNVGLFFELDEENSEARVGEDDDSCCSQWGFSPVLNWFVASVTFTS